MWLSVCTFINPACSSPPAGYTVWWEIPNVKSSREERSLSNSTLQCQLTGLTSTTVYTIQVAAVTAAGQGVVTSSTISTGVPPGAGVKHVLPTNGCLKLFSPCVFVLVRQSKYE